MIGAAFEQPDLFGGPPVRIPIARPMRCAESPEPFATPIATVEISASVRAFVEAQLDEYVAAVSSERSCRCQGRAKLDQADTLEAEAMVRYERNDDVTTLRAEGESMLRRATHHKDRAAAIALRLAEHVTLPLPV